MHPLSDRVFLPLDSGFLSISKCCKLFSSFLGFTFFLIIKETLENVENQNEDSRDNW